MTGTESSEVSSLDLSRQPGTPRQVRMGAVLLGFVMIIVLPLWVFSGVVAWQVAQTQRLELAKDATREARGIAEAVDFRLRSIETAISALALSSTLRSGDLASFYREAEAVARTQRGVLAIVDGDGRQLLNTNAPFGTELPPAIASTPFKAAIENRTTQVSQLFFGNVTARWLFTVVTPVIAEGRPPLALVIGLDAALTLGEVLQISDPPSTWALAIIDTEQRIMARKPHLDTAIGQTAHPSIVSLIGTFASGSGAARTIDDVPVQTFFQRTRKGGWMVVVGVRQAEFDAAISNALQPVLIAGFVVLAGSLLLAWMLGRRFNEQLASIASIAASYRRGDGATKPVPSAIAEFNELQATLSAAFAERERYAVQQNRALAEKDLLMQEGHHRVKNSLQLVRGILNLQARQAQHPEAKAALQTASARILTVAVIHQHLYQGVSTAEAQVDQYLADLVRDIGASTLPADSGRVITLSSDKALWPSEKLTALGLIAAELMTNAIKYGAGNINVAFSLHDDGISRLTVEDQGTGFSEDIELGSGSGLGSKVITSLVRPPEGDVMIDRSVPHGRVIVTFNAEWRSQQRREESDRR